MHSFSLSSHRGSHFPTSDQIQAHIKWWKSGAVNRIASLLNTAGTHSESFDPSRIQAHLQDPAHSIAGLGETRQTGWRWPIQDSSAGFLTSSYLPGYSIQTTWHGEIEPRGGQFSLIPVQGSQHYFPTENFTCYLYSTWQTEIDPDDLFDHWSHRGVYHLPLQFKSSQTVNVCMPAGDHRMPGNLSCLHSLCEPAPV